MTEPVSGNGKVSRFEPLAVEERYPPPRSRVDPEREKSWIKRLAPILIAHRGVIIVSFVCALSAVLVTSAIPKVIQVAVDTALPGLTGGEPLRSLPPFAWMLAALAAARFFFTYVFRYYLMKTSQLLEFDLRNLLHEHFNRLSFSFYDKVQTGQLISRANSDIRAVERFLTFAPMMLVTFVQFFVALAFMLQMHVALTLLSLAPLPFVYLTGRYLRSRLFPISWIVQSRMADVATIVEENVTGVRVVKSFAAERQQIGQLARAAAKLRWVSILMIDLRARFAPLMENLPRLGFLIVLLYGGWLTIQGEIKVGVILAFSAYILMLQVPFRILGFLMLMAQRAAASAQRIFEILDSRPDIEERPGAVDLVSPRGEVSFENVTFSYREGMVVLSNFDLRLEPGETVALVGRTGCGKSTVARLLPRFYDPDEGRVTIDGHDVRDLTIASLRAHVGLVLEEPFLFSESLRDNIAFGRPDASMEEIIEAAKAAGVHSFASELPQGYDTVIGERGYTLSGGQRQRVAIARTLLVSPPVLILDDATSSVDVQLEQEIHDALRTLMEGRTTLIIAHRLSTISLADRVLLMEAGRVLAEGTHNELLASVPLYAEVLAHAEEEWAAAHAAAAGEDDEALPPRIRALKRLAEARSERERETNPDLMGDLGRPI